jgi:superfamily II DNA or RNA helicase
MSAETATRAAPSGAALSIRDYQRDAIAGVFAQLKEHRSTLLVMATGLGKTVVFADIVRRAQQSGRGWRTLVLAHREELVFQAAKTIERVAGCHVDIEMGDLRASHDFLRRAPVVVSTVQTQVAGRGETKRMHRFKPSEFGLVIVDEAHHAIAGSYRTVIDHYMSNPAVRLLGVTATPDRTDEAALGEVFSSVAFEYGIREGIDGGWLVPVKQRVVHVQGLDFSGCRTTAGDLNGADLSAVLEYEATLHGMVSPTIEIVGDRRCLIFAASVAHAHRIAEILNRHRAGSAVAVDANTPREDRRAMFSGFSEGRYQFLVNVGVATEGWDDAALDGKGVQVIAMMRPTKSRALYCQMVGRGTRPLPGTVEQCPDAECRRDRIAGSPKPHVTVLDYCGNAGRHKLVHCVDALAGKDVDVRERAERRVIKEAEDGDVDVMAVLSEEEMRAKQEAEQAKRRGLVVKAGFVTQDIDPFSLIDLTPDRKSAWEKGVPATEAQLALIRKLRVAVPDLLTRNEARRLIDAAIATPTPKQQAVLIRAGFDPSNYDRKSASRVIDAIMAERKNR